jgi:type II secretory pathway pseudopilin PulG
MSVTGPPEDTLMSVSTSIHVPSRKRYGFSVTELLVVIGIIVLLVGLLLVALNNVRNSAKRTQTESTMNSFAAACDGFQIEHGFYPGVVPEQILAQDPQISGTENALLHLMGGFVREEDLGAAYASYDHNGEDSASEWREKAFSHNGGTYRIKINTRRIGDGPMINGTPYAPYFTPSDRELGRMLGEQVNEDPNLMLPDLMDSWGQPIIYVRQVRKRGPLTGDLAAKPQFLSGSIAPYLGSTDLGEQGRSQRLLTNPEDQPYSILNDSSADPDVTLARVLVHPALQDTPRGAYMLLSAGPDGIYLSSQDGPGSPNSYVGDITDTTTYPASVDIIAEYDDVRIFGGG